MLKFHSVIFSLKSPIFDPHNKRDVADSTEASQVVIVLHTRTLNIDDIHFSLLRQQGVRSVKVTSSRSGGALDGSPDSQAAYIITESEVNKI